MEKPIIIRKEDATMIVMKEKGKYYPLYRYLQQQESEKVIISFSQIEEIIGTALPNSAYKHQAWWGNTRSGTYVQSAAWLEAGFRVDAIAFGETIEFNRAANILLTKKRNKVARRT